MQNAKETTIGPAPVEQLGTHAESALVPGCTSEEYTALLADIRERGVVTPLDLTKDLVVLDGRQRLRAARELGLKMLPTRIVVPADEVAYMLLAALRRRHLSVSQRAALALELEEYQRMRADALKRSRANLRSSPEVAMLPPRGERTRELAARVVGVSARSVQDAITVREADAELFAEVKAGRIPVAKAARRVRQAQRRLQLEPDPVMPEGCFQVVYADPPWQLGGDPESPHAPENHYPTMPLEEIESLAISAAEDAVLFLWAPCGLMPQGLEVMGAWGFRYRAQLVWVKPSPGLGYFVRYQHELLLIGLRGHFPSPEPELRPPSVLTANRGRHSQKPSEMYELIERMYPQASKLELFARKARPGWAAFGNEVAP